MTAECPHRNVLPDPRLTCCELASMTFSTINDALQYV